ncbi:lipopolysaccharide biosynthesis protein [Jatrophihabitans endophyticus]|uniref:lipopolysaccharide biosynthesis protein n=1 Tax=Jatrophihabitans endophyticus TaxID=1206085 RepID=UPI0019D84549|nr:lipopolysaccharide biosynthesis protein [Jatrophihabitans endophyticus]MBE7187643.1 lipopolysaccharide biosynthesis protein [Jatrophihabitans endophyticus]
MLDTPAAPVTSRPAPAGPVAGTPAGETSVAHGRVQGGHWRRSVGVLAVATILIGLANYLTSLIAAHLLPAAQFDEFAAGQSLLLVLGTGSFAALPWAVARYVARDGGDDVTSEVRVTSEARAQQAMYFGLVGAVLQGLVLAPIALVVCWGLDGPLFGVAGGLAALVISVLAGPIGFLQGRQALTTIAAVRVIETAVRVALTMLIVLAVSQQAAVALFAFPIGSLLALGYALHRGRAGFPLRRLGRATALRLTREAGLLGAIQVLLAMLGALDTVYAAAGHFTAEQTASYQAAALLARIPLFFSAAVSTAVYTELAATRDDIEAGLRLRGALRTYLWLSVPFVVGYLTVPVSVLGLAIPADFTQTAPVLRVVCVAGVLVGVINVVTTGHQARGGFGSCLAILVGSVAVQGAALWAAAQHGGLLLFAALESAVCAATVAALAVDARRWWSGARLHLVARRPALLVALGVVGALASAIGHRPPVWIASLVLVSGGALAGAFTHPVASRSTGQALGPKHRRSSATGKLQETR